MSDSFRSRVRSFVDSKITPHVAEWEVNRSYPESLNQLAGKAGILSLGYTEDRLPDDPQNLAILVEELTLSGAQGIVMGLASHFVSLRAIESSAHPVAGRVIRQVLRGERSIALAMTEPQTGSDLTSIACRADAENRLTGTKAFICNGERADFVLVYAMAGDGPALLLVERQAAGIRYLHRECIGWRCLPLADIELNDTPSIPLIKGKGVNRLLQVSLQQERLNLAVMAVTSARLALQAAVDYCKVRHSGGERLIDKSVLRQRLSGHRAHLEVVKHYVEDAVRWQAKGALQAVDVAIAKRMASQCLEAIARDAVQLHGAHGCVEPALVERVYRDARLLGIGGGTDEIMLEIVGRSL
ncbi:Acyl-CoA dehydrogenase, short-chain specific [Paraburkholderia caribensis MBA4]|uniref:Acyl-CoA dehydrogenase, short-chain specific n=1 Tax=Paraburkholderia caribensis MBA4 TaxID=1323664 RepID=A0A0P0RGE1_9BURK|nr:acyl-CoA dehydrogenase family protein [Paraburkholderia caribensis]ALL67610.1 Acyl-CoA dehydrogenase, short-chain specific [Paraburkholderia caribensis MBA4]